MYAHKHKVLCLTYYILCMHRKLQWDFPYGNLIVVNKTSEPIKIEIPVFHEEWIAEHRDLGLEVIPVTKDDNYLSMWKRAHAELDKIRP